MDRKKAKKKRIMTMMKRMKTNMKVADNVRCRGRDVHAGVLAVCLVKRFAA